MAAPPARELESYISTADLSAWLRVLFLYSTDSLDDDDAAELEEAAPDLANQCRFALERAVRDSLSTHRLSMLAVWSSAELIFNSTSPLARLIEQQLLAPDFEIEMLRPLEQRVLDQWFTESVKPLPGLPCPNQDLRHERTIALLERTLLMLSDPDPVLLYTQSMVAARSPRLPLLQAGDSDNVASVIGYVENTDIRRVLGDILLTVGGVELQTMIHKRDPMALWIALVSVLTLRIPDTVVYAIGHCTLRLGLPGARIQCWYVPAVNSAGNLRGHRVGVRWAGHGWRSKMEAGPLLDLAITVLLARPETAVLYDEFI